MQGFFIISCEIPVFPAENNSLVRGRKKLATNGKHEIYSNLTELATSCSEFFNLTTPPHPPIMGVPKIVLQMKKVFKIAGDSEKTV